MFLLCSDKHKSNMPNDAIVRQRWDMKKIILMIITIATITSSCRYKEGPAISFRSVKSRLFGNWKVMEFNSNGIDSLKYYNDSCGCKMNIPTLSDEQDILFYDCHNTLHYRGSFSFSHNKKIMKVTYYGQFHYIGPIAIDSDWEILRLTKDNLKISTTVNNANYIISFEKLN